MSTTTELQPCPLCGSRNIVSGQDDLTNWHIGCEDCGCQVGDNDSKGDERWNRRSAAHGEQSNHIEDVRAMVSDRDLFVLVNKLDALSIIDRADWRTAKNRAELRALLSSAPAQACSAEQSEHVEPNLDTPTPSTDQPNVSKNGAEIDFDDARRFLDSWGCMVHPIPQIIDLAERVALSARQAPEMIAAGHFERDCAGEWMMVPRQFVNRPGVVVLYHEAPSAAQKDAT